MIASPVVAVSDLGRGVDEVDDAHVLWSTPDLELSGRARCRPLMKTRGRANPLTLLVASAGERYVVACGVPYRLFDDRDGSGLVSILRHAFEDAAIQRGCRAVAAPIGALSLGARTLRETFCQLSIVRDWLGPVDDRGESFGECDGGEVGVGAGDVGPDRGVAHA